jgi:hypothetical protein
LPTIKIDLDPESFRRLTAIAVEERRPIPWQAEVILIRALADPADDPQHPITLHDQSQEVPCVAE